MPTLNPFAPAAKPRRISAADLKILRRVRDSYFDFDTAEIANLRRRGFLYVDVDRSEDVTFRRACLLTNEGFRALAELERQQACPQPQIWAYLLWNDGVSVTTALGGFAMPATLDALLREVKDWQLNHDADSALVKLEGVPQPRYSYRLA